MRALHLFAGGGGSVITGRALGWSSVGAVEIDPFCCAVLEHHGERVLSRDVRTFDAARHHGLVDVVVGGWPCQGNSTAGKRLGLADDRSNLWWQLLRVLVETGARYLFAENVRGVLSVNGGRDFGVILNSLADAGFDARWTVTRASDVGAPHRRERLWLFAWRRDVADADSFSINSLTLLSRVIDPGVQPQHGDERRAVRIGVCRSSGDPAELAHATGNGRGPRESRPSERQGRCGQSSECGGEGVANAARQHDDGCRDAGTGRRDEHSDGGGDVGLATRCGCERCRSSGQRLVEPQVEAGAARRAVDGVDIGGSPQRRMGGADHGMAGWMDHWPAARGLWPSGRGAAQHAWEAPRVVEKRAKGDIQALKALGNGWVPAQAIAAWRELTEGTW